MVNLLLFLYYYNYYYFYFYFLIGQIAEYDTPTKLVQNPLSIFTKLLNESNMTLLPEVSKKTNDEINEEINEE